MHYMRHQLKMSKEARRMNPKKSTIGAKPNTNKGLSLIAIWANNPKEGERERERERERESRTEDTEKIDAHVD